MSSETNELPTVEANTSGHAQRFSLLEGLAKFWRVIGWISLVVGVSAAFVFLEPKVT